MIGKVIDETLSPTWDELHYEYKMNEWNKYDNNKYKGDWRDVISNLGPASPHSLSACVWHQVPYVHFYHFVNLHNVVFFQCTKCYSNINTILIAFE